MLLFKCGSADGHARLRVQSDKKKPEFQSFLLSVKQFWSVFHSAEFLFLLLFLLHRNVLDCTKTTVCFCHHCGLSDYLQKKNQENWLFALLAGDAWPLRSSNKANSPVGSMNGYTSSCPEYQSSAGIYWTYTGPQHLNTSRWASPRFSSHVNKNNCSRLREAGLVPLTRNSCYSF